MKTKGFENEKVSWFKAVSCKFYYQNRHSHKQEENFDITHACKVGKLRTMTLNRKFQSLHYEYCNL